MPLRLQATEDDVYHLMDLKEQYFIMTAICSVAEGISAYFFIYQKRCWDAEDEVKWAEKVICNFGVYAGTPLGEMMQDARGYQTIKWLVQRYKGQNQEIQKAAKILLDHEKEMQKAA